MDYSYKWKFGKKQLTTGDNRRRTAQIKVWKALLIDYLCCPDLNGRPLFVRLIYFYRLSIVLSLSLTAIYEKLTEFAWTLQVYKLRAGNHRIGWVAWRLRGQHYWKTWAQATTLPTNTKCNFVTTVSAVQVSTDSSNRAGIEFEDRNWQ